MKRVIFPGLTVLAMLIIASLIGSAANSRALALILAAFGTVPLCGLLMRRRLKREDWGAYIRWVEESGMGRTLSLSAHLFRTALAIAIGIFAAAVAFDLFPSRDFPFWAATMSGFSFGLAAYLMIATRKFREIGLIR